MKRKLYINLALIITSNFITSSCTPMKRAETAIARGVGGSVLSRVDGNEVYCSQGRVCSEVEVMAIWVEDRDNGKVRVVLKNRTGNTALVQIRLEIISASGEVLTESRPENFPIPATQEKSYEMPGIARKGATVRVQLNTAQ
jgi:hypothetical protein